MSKTTPAVIFEPDATQTAAVPDANMPESPDANDPDINSSKRGSGAGDDHLVGLSEDAPNPAKDLATMRQGRTEAY